ncbi:MAG: phage capsid protein [Caldilinea sp.]
MAITTFIPTVWAADLLTSLKRSQVYAQPGVVNRNYEGLIRERGDTVKITGIGAITLKNYTENTDMDSPETLTDDTRSLVIDQQKYFNFQVDDVDAAQMMNNGGLRMEAMAEAGYAVRDAQDAYVASLYTAADAGNLVGTTAAPKTDLGTAGKPYEYLLELSVLLDNANVPSDQRWAVVPSWFHALLLQDQRFVNTGSAQAESRLSNAIIGSVAGFTVLKSNNVPNTTATKYRIIAGHPGAITFAEQIGKIEAYRMEKRFADAIKGLNLYGAKVVRPTALAVLTANKP